MDSSQNASGVASDANAIKPADAVPGLLASTREWRSASVEDARWQAAWASASDDEIRARRVLRARSFPEGFPRPALPLLMGDEAAFLLAAQADPRLAIASICACSSGREERLPLFEWAWKVGLKRPAQWVSGRLKAEMSADELPFLLGDLAEPVASRPGHLSGARHLEPAGPVDKAFWAAIGRHQRTGDGLFFNTLRARPQLAKESNFWRLWERSMARQGPYELSALLARLEVDPDFSGLRSTPEDAKTLERAAKNSLFRLARQKRAIPAALAALLIQLGAQTTPRPLFLSRRLPGQRPLSKTELAAFSAGAAATPAELAFGEGFLATAASLASLGLELGRERLEGSFGALSGTRLAQFESLALAQATRGEPLAKKPSEAEAPRSARLAPRL